MGHLSLVHVRSVVWWERARLRVYDLWATRTGMFSFRKMLVTLWFSRSEMYGILKYDHSALVGRASLWWFRGHFAWCMLFSGYPFRRRMSSNAFCCFVVVVCVEHLSSIRFRSLRSLKFEIEKPETTPDGLSLSLLDFKVTISKDGKSSFEFYKKSAKKPLFVHHKSAIPMKSKTNFIRNERKRIEDRCSTQTTTTKHHTIALNRKSKISRTIRVNCGVTSIVR